jgi:hypothetical protein
MKGDERQRNHRTMRGFCQTGMAITAGVDHRASCRPAQGARFPATGEASVAKDEELATSGSAAVFSPLNIDKRAHGFLW